MKLSEQIRAASAAHKKAFPDGDWKSCNEELGRLFMAALPILVKEGLNPWAGGNEGRANTLESLGF